MQIERTRNCIPVDIAEKLGNLLIQTWHDPDIDIGKKRAITFVVGELVKGGQEGVPLRTIQHFLDYSNAQELTAKEFLIEVGPQFQTQDLLIVQLPQRAELAS